ncbi:MAG: DUF2391 family protein [Candidatus Aenigmarchaeota archaeon]|nr:DUF2391 family protein [Candidatus Aenigmarchaeota archaeon]
MPKTREKREIVRLGGKLKEIITVRDKEGKIIHRIISPLMIEFKLKDVLQVIIGATILAVPVAFTEEVWLLGETLPILNIGTFLFLSVLFIGTFDYYNFYRNRIEKHWQEFVKRVFFTYIFSFIVVGIILYLIQKTPWNTDWLLAVKRIIIVTFPSSMSAAIADTIK